jgi:hypothetical protein
MKAPSVHKEGKHGRLLSRPQQVCSAATGDNFRTAVHAVLMDHFADALTGWLEGEAPRVCAGYVKYLDK